MGTLSVRRTWYAFLTLPILFTGCTEGNQGQETESVSAQDLTTTDELLAQGWELCLDLVAGEDVEAARWTPGAAAPEDIDAVLRCLGPAPPDVAWEEAPGELYIELSVARALPAAFIAFLDDPGPAESAGPDEECPDAGYMWHEYLLSTAKGWFVTDLVIDPAIGTCAPIHLLPEEVSVAMQWEVLGTREPPARR